MYSEQQLIKLSDILYEEDPAHTCCAENDCYDEYDSIVESLSELPFEQWEPKMKSDFGAADEDLLTRAYNRWKQAV